MKKDYHNKSFIQTFLHYKLYKGRAYVFTHFCPQIHELVQIMNDILIASNNRKDVVL